MQIAITAEVLANLLFKDIENTINTWDDMYAYLLSRISMAREEMTWEKLAMSMVSSDCFIRALFSDPAEGDIKVLSKKYCFFMAEKMIDPFEEELVFQSDEDFELTFDTVKPFLIEMANESLNKLKLKASLEDIPVENMYRV